MARTANSSDSTIAAAIATMTPSVRLPVAMVTAKADIAPITIMPSTPMLRTPASSTTSSPSAAYTSGVPATSVAMMSCVSCPIIWPSELPA
jgi:hypothetical protein